MVFMTTKCVTKRLTHMEGVGAIIPACRGWVPGLLLFQALLGVS